MNLVLDSNLFYSFFNRHGGRYSYSALEDEGTGGERLELERKVTNRATRESSGVAARAFMRSQPRYSLIEHLRDIGKLVDHIFYF